MAGRDDEHIPGFNAPLADAGPIVSKRTGRRRARVQEVFGAPQKMIPLGRRRHEHDTAAVIDDDLDNGPGRGRLRGIVLTLLLLIGLGTRGCGLFDGGDSDESPVPTPTTSIPTGPPPLVQRLPATPPSEIGDGSGGTPTE